MSTGAPQLSQGTWLWSHHARQCSLPSYSPTHSLSHLGSSRAGVESWWAAGFDHAVPLLTVAVVFQHSYAPAQCLLEVSMDGATFERIGSMSAARFELDGGEVASFDAYGITARYVRVRMVGGGSYHGIHRVRFGAAGRVAEEASLASSRTAPASAVHAVPSAMVTMQRLLSSSTGTASASAAMQFAAAAEVALVGTLLQVMGLATPTGGSGGGAGGGAGVVTSALAPVYTRLRAVLTMLCKAGNSRADASMDMHMSSSDSTEAAVVEEDKTDSALASTLSASDLVEALGSHSAKAAAVAEWTLVQALDAVMDPKLESGLGWDSATASASNVYHGPSYAPSSNYTDFPRSAPLPPALTHSRCVQPPNHRRMHCAKHWGLLLLR